MICVTQLATIIETLNANEDVCFCKVEIFSSRYISVYEGTIGSKWVIKIAFPPYFPVQLPDIYVNSAPVGTLHIGSDGKLCLFNKSSILLDTANPVGIVSECISTALDILSLCPGTQEYLSELKKEFSAYWDNNCKICIYCSLEMDEIEFAEIPILKVSNVLYVISHSIIESKRLLHDVLRISNTDADAEGKALVVRLRDDADLLSPFKKLSWQAFTNYLKRNVTKSASKKLSAYICRQHKNQNKRREIIVAIFPNGDNALIFGFATDFQLLSKPMISIPNASYQAAIKRIDYDYMTKRSGAESRLQNKHVLLLGCGSVGGFIANNLCQLGITKLDLVDDDILLLDNVHRHFLGADAARSKGSRNKADLLGNTLSNKYIHVEIDTLSYVDRDVASIFFSSNRWNNYDLIISALGEPTINLEINRRLRDAESNTPFITCFNEPYGIGGHVIALNLSHSQDSCLQCLYTLGDDDGMGFRGSFVESGQSFEMSLSGCAGTFVPYSSLDSQQTALHVARTAIKVLMGQISYNCLISWKGDATTLVDLGFRTSNRFQTLESDVTVVDNLKNENCYVCSPKRHGDQNDI